MTGEASVCRTVRESPSVWRHLREKKIKHGQARVVRGNDQQGQRPRGRGLLGMLEEKCG